MSREQPACRLRGTTDGAGRPVVLVIEATRLAVTMSADVAQRATHNRHTPQEGFDNGYATRNTLRKETADRRER